MAKTNTNIHVAMRKAGIPAAYRTLTLSTHPLGAGLARIIGDTKFSSNGIRQSHVLRSRDMGRERHSEILPLVALSLLRVGEDVHLTSLVAIARMLRYFEVTNGDEDSPTLARGDGFIVLTDYTGHRLAEREYEDVAVWLSEHLARGGGLVFLEPEPAKGKEPEYPPALAVSLFGAKVITI